MPKAIRIQQQGGPEVLKWEDVQVGAPGPGEARVRHKACGLNFLDVYQRSGLYKIPLPSGMGNEGAGVVEAIGAGVTHVKVGDRVAYAGGSPGAYSEVRNMSADRLVVLPEGISFETGAAMMLKGMTAQYLIRRTYKVQSGETVLFHATAGGVGLIACQWLKALGATVIGTAGSEEKCALAKAHGADHCINYRKENFVERLKALTGGKGVPVVYDSVGKDSFTGSLDCLQPRGLMVSFGNSSGAVPAFELGVLSQKGSLYVTRPTLVTHTSKREDLVATAKDLFDVVLSGKVKIEVNHRYALKDAAQAQRDLEARKPHAAPGRRALDVLGGERRSGRDSRGFPARRTRRGQHPEAPAVFRPRRLPHRRLRPARRRSFHAARRAARQHDAASCRRPRNLAQTPGGGTLGRVRGLLGQHPGDRVRAGAPRALPRARPARDLPVPQKRDRMVSLRPARRFPRALAEVRRLSPAGGARRSAAQLSPALDRPRPRGPHAGGASLEHLRGVVLDPASQPRDGGVFCRRRCGAGVSADRGALFRERNLSPGEFAARERTPAARHPGSDRARALRHGLPARVGARAAPR